MKTIEKRATEYVMPLIDEHSEGNLMTIRIAYMNGAKDQKKIDIEKACEWFEKYLTEIGYPDDWCRDSEVQESGEKRFRKFMEE